VLPSRVGEEDRQDLDYRGANHSPTISRRYIGSFWSSSLRESPTELEQVSVRLRLSRKLLCSGSVVGEWRSRTKRIHPIRRPSRGSCGRESACPLHLRRDSEMSDPAPGPMTSTAIMRALAGETSDFSHSVSMSLYRRPYAVTRPTFGVCDPGLSVPTCVPELRSDLGAVGVSIRIAVLHACYTNTAALLRNRRFQSQVRIRNLVGGPGFQPGASRSRNLSGVVH
jgi:hypothetical protein